MVDRRRFMKMFSYAVLPSVCSVSSTVAYALAGQTSEAAHKNAITREEWLDKAVAAANRDAASGKSSYGPLAFGRFVERMYFLMRPIHWSPTPGVAEQKGYPAVTVPIGFVTDLASIPQIFYSLLPPDGPYTFPAIIHDYLYWSQTGSKSQADHILNFGMEDFKVDNLTRDTIYNAVHFAGQSAWNGNAKLKAKGEKRILARFPEDPTTLWVDWKKNPRNFA
jgi:hypothetical protein